MLKIKKNDIVEVTKGKDKGKKGKVIELFAEKNKALVEGINLAKKHSRQTRQDQKGGIISIEKPISIANIGYVCKSCNKPVKVGFKVAADGTKERVCKKCGGTI